MLELLRQRPRSAREIALELWGDLAVSQAFLTTSEVIGHVDILIESGLVDEESRGTTACFVARGT